jgi:hypothetical protein
VVTTNPERPREIPHHGYHLIVRHASIEHLEVGRLAIILRLDVCAQESNQGETDRSYAYRAEAQQCGDLNPPEGGGETGNHEMSFRAYGNANEDP